MPDGFISLGAVPSGIAGVLVPALEIDPVTFALIGGALFTICQEMDITLRNTSLSPIINIGKDFSCAIFTADAQLVAQACNCPGHVGSMHYAVTSCIEAVGLENVFEDDVYILNDPYHGGTHLPDITLITPVFYRGELVMFCGNRAHHSDMGGSVPGSFPLSRDIYEEGIRIPPLKFCDHGRRNDAILEILLANVRTPREVEGDLEAQLAANAAGARGLVRLMDKYGRHVVLSAVMKYMEHSERAFRASLKVAEGTYAAEDWLDGDGTDDRRRTIRVAVTIKGTDVYVDFTGTDRQASGPINSVLPTTASMVVTAFLSLTDPTIMPNHGFYRPIHLKVPEGTLLNPIFPAPTVGFPDVCNRVFDVIMKALTPVMPERVIASTSGTTMNAFFGGIDPSTGHPYVWYSINSQGGWGARSGHDGWHNVCFIEANGWDIPIETIEYRYPWRIVEYRLRDDTTGAGTWRGGKGNRMVLTPIDHDALFAINGDRAVTSPSGLFGGYPGATAHCTIVRADGRVERVAPTMNKADRVVVRRGDTVVIEAPSGGGYGNPLDRDVDAVNRDVRDRIATLESARADYGVVMTDDALNVNRQATDLLRAEMRGRFDC